MTKKLFVSIGECMIEMMPMEDGHFRFGIAGDTLNTAWYTRAMLPKDQWEVSYLTRLGTDPYSAKISQFLSDNDITTQFTTQDEKRRPGLYMIEVDNGERSFTYWRDTSAARLLADDEDNMRAALNAADTIYFSGITLAILNADRRAFLLEAIDAARSAGKMTVFDPNIRPRLWESADAMRETLAAAGRVATICLPSYDDEAATFGDASPEACLARYAGYGCDYVVVKNGGGPVWYQSAEGKGYLTDLPKIQPIDTTSAGDSFNGAFLSALVSGKAIEAAVHEGHALATRVIRFRGALMPADQIAQAS